MYITYKTKVQGLGLVYEINTTFGDVFLLVQYIDGMCEIFFHDSNKEIISILLDTNEAKILSRLLTRSG